jgi:ParB family transcriptional regulator, chromosome partitioning protein
MKMHELKTIQPYFDEVWSGWKNFEIRKDDRGFKERDILWLREFDPKTKEYGREILAQVEYILPANTFAGLSSGYCAMSIDILQRKDKTEVKK